MVFAAHDRCKLSVKVCDIFFGIIMACISPMLFQLKHGLSAFNMSTVNVTFVISRQNPVFKNNSELKKNQQIDIIFAPVQYNEFNPGI